MRRDTISVLFFRSYSLIFTMADSYASVTEVAALVANVNGAAKSFQAANGGDVHAARRNLQLEARKLLYALEEPNTEVWPRIFQVKNPILVSNADLLVYHYLVDLLTVHKGQC